MSFVIPHCLGGDGEAIAGYQFFKNGFKLATFIYYNGIDCLGMSNFPAVGEPSILCFNHSAGLTDPMMLMRSCPRMVRFIAKDSLWKSPFYGWMVKGSGAVPVRRAEEHGEGRDNADVFEAVTEALDDGQLVGVAPEANSKMRTMLVDFKKGPAIMAVQSVFKHFADGDDAFVVRIVPCGLVFLHQQRWRSQVLVRFGKPIVVDAARLRAAGITLANTDPRSEERRNCINGIMSELRDAMENLTLHIPPAPDSFDDPQTLEGDWVSLKRGIVAARLIWPLGAQVPLEKWVDGIVHLARVLSPSGMHEELAQELSIYQATLDATGISDCHLWQHSENASQKICGLLCQIVLLAVPCMILFAIATPGALLWLPTWLPCIVMEWNVLRKGKVERSGIIERRRSNFDTIATNKLFIGFVMLSFTCLLFFFVAALWLPHPTWGWVRSISMGMLIGFVVVPLLLWLTVRWLEEGMALLRVICSLWALVVIRRDKLEGLITKRSQLVAEVNALGMSSTQDKFSSPGFCASMAGLFSWVGRKKQDWHETFALYEDLSFCGLHEEDKDLPSSSENDSVEVLIDRHPY